MFGKVLASTTTTTLLTSCINMLAGVIIARSIGPEGRGALGAIITWPPIFMTLFFLGLQDWVSIQIGKSQDSLSHSKEFHSALIWGGLLGTLGILAGNLAFPYLISSGQIEYLSLFRLYSIYTLLALLLGIYNYGAMALNHTPIFNASRYIQAISHALMVFAIANFWNNDLKLYVIEHLLMVVFPLAYFFTKYPPRFKSFGLNYTTMKSSIAFYPSYLLATLSLLFDRALAVYFLSNKEIGHYHIANTLAITMTSILGLTFQYLLLPTASQIENMRERQKYVIANIQFCLCLLLITTTACIPLTKPLFVLVFGEAFAPSADAAYHLLPAFAFLFSKSLATRSIKSLNMTWISNLIEIIYILGLISLTLYFTNIDQLNIINLSKACLWSSISSYALFLILFKIYSDIKIKDMLNLRNPTQMLLKKLQGLL